MHTCLLRQINKWPRQRNIYENTKELGKATLQKIMGFN